MFPLATVSVRDVATSPLIVAVLDVNSTSPMRTPKKEKRKSVGFLGRSRSQLRISSSSLIQKIFGTPKKHLPNQKQNSAEQQHRSVEQPQHKRHHHAPVDAQQQQFKKPSLDIPGELNAGKAAHFRKPRLPLTSPKLRSYTSTVACTTTTPKRPHLLASTGDGNEMFVVNPSLTASQQCQMNSIDINFMGHSPGFFQAPSNTIRIANNCRREKPLREEHPPTPELVYDERLKEWIYPLDESIVEQLERLAYFCRPNEKNYVLDQLRRMPIGHFMLRLSGSRRRCLALTVRVEQSEANTKGISHFLVLRNEHGFRIRGSKRYFQSLPMLITHHSVLAEQLPCRLQLSDWRWTRESQVTRRRQSSGGSTLAVLSARDKRRQFFEQDTHCQNAFDHNNMIRWRPQTGGPKWKPTTEGHHRRVNTSSTLFSSQSSTMLSA